MKYVWVVLLTLLVTACGGLPSASNVEWYPRELLKEGCPDLTGSYFTKGFDVERIGGGAITEPGAGWPRWGRPSDEYVKSQPTYLEIILLPESEWMPVSITGESDATMIFSITKKDNAWIQEIRTPRSIVRAISKIDHPMNGCYNGAFISRGMGATGGGDSFADRHMYAVQAETRKLSDGSLQITGGHSVGRTSKWTGNALQKLDMPVQELLAVYPPADKP